MEDIIQLEKAINNCIDEFENIQKKANKIFKDLEFGIIPDSNLMQNFNEQFKHITQNYNCLLETFRQHNIPLDYNLNYSIKELKTSFLNYKEDIRKLLKEKIDIINRFLNITSDNKIYLDAIKDEIIKINILKQSFNQNSFIEDELNSFINSLTKYEIFIKYIETEEVSEDEFDLIDKEFNKIILNGLYRKRYYINETFNKTITNKKVNFFRGKQTKFGVNSFISDTKKNPYMINILNMFSMVYIIDNKQFYELYNIFVEDNVILKNNDIFNKLMRKGYLDKIFYFKDGVKREAYVLSSVSIEAFKNINTKKLLEEASIPFNKNYNKYNWEDYNIYDAEYQKNLLNSFIKISRYYNNICKFKNDLVGITDLIFNNDNFYFKIFDNRKKEESELNVELYYLSKDTTLNIINKLNKNTNIVTILATDNIDIAKDLKSTTIFDINKEEFTKKIFKFFSQEDKEEICVINEHIDIFNTEELLKLI